MWEVLLDFKVVIEVIWGLEMSILTISPLIGMQVLDIALKLQFYKYLLDDW